MKTIVPINLYKTELLECDVSDNFIEEMNTKYALVWVRGPLLTDLRILASGTRFELYKTRFAKKSHLNIHASIQLPDGSITSASYYKIWMHSPYRRWIQPDTELAASSQQLYEAECKLKEAAKQAQIARRALDMASNDDCEKELKRHSIFDDKWSKAREIYQDRQDPKYFIGF
jgi:hypothetical protein